MSFVYHIMPKGIFGYYNFQQLDDIQKKWTVERLRLFLRVFMLKKNVLHFHSDYLLLLIKIIDREESNWSRTAYASRCGYMVNRINCAHVKLLKCNDYPNWKPFNACTFANGRFMVLTGSCAENVLFYFCLNTCRRSFWLVYLNMGSHNAEYAENPIAFYLAICTIWKDILVHILCNAISGGY